MSLIHADVDFIEAEAIRLKNYNNAIYEGFTVVEASMKGLDAHWEGVAAAAAFNKFRGIRPAFCDARFNVMNNFSDVLVRQVGDGYRQTETLNSTLADSFK